MVAGASFALLRGHVSSSRNISAWLLSCAIAATPLQADVVINLRTTDFSSEVPAVEETRMVVRPPGGGQTEHGATGGQAEDGPGGGRTEDSGLLKMDITSARRGASKGSTPRDHTLIFRGGESSSITVVDHHRKSFSILDRESMAAFSAEMRMLMQATSTRIEALPPEQREIVRKMFENQQGPGRSAASPTPGTVVKTSERDTISGMPCVKYEVFQGGRKLREVWVAPPAAVRGGEPALALLREMSDFYGVLVGSLGSQASGLSGGLGSGQNPFEDLDRMNGFPVLTRNFSGGRVNSEIALLSVEEQRLSLAEFEPPPDYSPPEAPEPAKR